MFLKKIKLGEEGQGLVEYALVLVLVAVVVIGILGLLGSSKGSSKGWWWHLWHETPPYTPRLYFEDIEEVVIRDINVNSVKVADEFLFEEDSKIAVLNFRSPNNTQGGVLVSDIFAALLREQGYQVYERDEIDRLLNEQQLLKDGVILASDIEIAQKLGNLASVDYMILGAVTIYKSEAQKIYIPIRIEEEDINSYIEEYNTYHDWYVNKWRPWTWDYWTLSDREKADNVRVEEGVWSLDEYLTELEKETINEYRIIATIGISAKVVDIRTGEIVWMGQAETTDFTLVNGAKRIINEFSESIIELPSEIEADE